MMRRHFSTIDIKTGKELIFSQCSYNLACEWLEILLKQDGLKVYKTETNNGLVCMYTAKRTFFYDEERGYLLGD